MKIFWYLLLSVEIMSLTAQAKESTMLPLIGRFATLESCQNVVDMNVIPARFVELTGINNAKAVCVKNINPENGFDVILSYDSSKSFNVGFRLQKPWQLVLTPETAYTPQIEKHGEEYLISLITRTIIGINRVPANPTSLEECTKLLDEVMRVDPVIYQHTVYGSCIKIDDSFQYGINTIASDGE
jgi:hypothetical protein